MAKHTISRRRLINLAGAAAVSGGALNLLNAAPAPAMDFPIIDTHIHLFDPTRPQGVPWPSKDDKVLYQPALPDRYRKIAQPFGITGAIEVECSPWPEDNQWVLDVAAKDNIIVGTVGNLEPGKPEFRAQLDRLHKNPLFLGIRYGNLWGRDLGAEIRKPAFVADLKALAGAGLVLDTANQNAELIAAALRVTDLVPNLRIVIDHLPQFAPPADANLRELGTRPQVYAKVSEVLRRVGTARGDASDTARRDASDTARGDASDTARGDASDTARRDASVAGRVPTDLGFYRPKLDELFGIFGEDRLLFGSDWPNSDNWAPYPQVFGIVRDYFTAKGPVIAEKYFRKNSVAAYRWVKRAG